MKLGLWDYLRAAFSARPIGMLVPPNWIGLAGFGLLGLVNPGFWLVGAGLELAYLYTLSTNARFQNVVRGQQLLQEHRAWNQRLLGLLSQLGPTDRQRYQELQQRCQSILEPGQASGAGGTAAAGDFSESGNLRIQGEGLSRLLWIYLNLLLTRQAIGRVLRQTREADQDRLPLDQRLKQLQEKLKDTELRDDLRKSLTSQAEILQQRLEKRQEAKQKLAFLEAELVRIQEQVELIREQGVLTTDPDVVSQRIDQVAATLGGTTQWLQEQQQIYGQVEDLLTEPPPEVAATLQPPTKESQ